MQQDKPIAFISKSLPNRKQGLSTYKKELLAIVYAVQKWKAYLHGNRFTIKTDHYSLKYFLEQKITTLLQQTWLTKLLGYDYGWANLCGQLWGTQTEVNRRSPLFGYGRTFRGERNYEKTAAILWLGNFVERGD
ncbi:hypothetical protein JRO89_XS06G0106800 [Xanthoceras sorbifolium]|uniref:Reverse transcriptase RNase H-like domain-containing protein n=1 Tax=Xanthoceras sorbifolium TaxID=99658 RepID=A0ABQ8HXL3_9ROSI|nr:hypothetical protein JRO89_XS06G0106800 [Xanthoceras sorbifolium]